MQLSEKLVIRWQRLVHYEYWPFWLFYAPMVPYGIWLSLKARSFTFFSAVNPGITNSGVVESSKYDILKLINPEWLPAMVLVPVGISIENALKNVNETGIVFPLIAKPDIGERGAMVEKINSITELEAYLSAAKMDTIIQEYIDYPLELGVFYHRYPNEQKGEISSVVIKEFLTITGDGKRTIRELMEAHIRAQKRLDYLENKFGERLNEILPADEKLLLEPIGNHSRGTTFINGGHLINDQLVTVFDEIAKDIPGFYYGRFDIKVPTEDDLYAGRNIKIMELNGVSSEPAHIYDPSFGLFNAYREMFRHLHIIYLIGTANHRAGIPYMSLAAFLSEMKKHYKRQGRMVMTAE